jgi:hypothetical protein
MDSATEKQVLATLYDRLFDAICYAPAGRSAATDKNTSRLLMAKNLVVSEADMANAVSPVNPSPQADFRTAKAFSDLVDVVPLDGVEWIGSGNTVSDMYARLVEGANSRTPEDPEQRKNYDLAASFLVEEVETKDFRGNVKKTRRPTPVSQTYDDNQTAYAAATMGYRTAYNGYDLSKPQDQRQWNAVEPGLNNTLQQAWNKWVRESKAEVEEAQAVMATTINNAVRQAIAAQQLLVAAANRQAPLVAGTPAWFLSYAQPSNWYEASLAGSKLTLRSDYLNQTADSEATSYAAGGSGSWGLWSFGGKTGRTEQKDHAHTDTKNFALMAELMQVRIVRPWYSPLLLSMQGWYTNAFMKGAFTSAMPLVATSMVVARNVTIKAEFGEQDKQKLQSATTAQASVGWGPFAVSGSYSHSETHEKFTAKFDGGTLTLPGLQVIGFVCARTPFCPPQDG